MIAPLIFASRRFPALKLVAAIAMLTTILPLAGCGYNGKSLYPSSIRTVAVPIFANRTFRRQWEFKLTEAIDKNIESRTPFRLAPEGQADSILTGTIHDINESVLTNRFQNNLPQETEITVVVDFTWKDVRTGRILVERKNFARESTVIPQIGERLPDAEQQAVERLARGIVEQMQTGF